MRTIEFALAFGIPREIMNLLIGGDAIEGEIGSRDGSTMSRNFEKIASLDRFGISPMSRDFRMDASLLDMLPVQSLAMDRMWGL